MKNLPTWLVKQYENRAKNEIEGGTIIEINANLPYISITSANGENWYFDNNDAQKLLDGVPKNIDVETFILATSQNW